MKHTIFALGLVFLFVFGCTEKGNPQPTAAKSDDSLNTPVYRYPFVSPNPRQWGYIDESGNQKVQPQFSSAGYFFDGLAAVRIGEAKSGGKVGFIDHDGKFVINPTFDECSNFELKKAICRKGGTPNDSLCGEALCLFDGGQIVVIDAAGRELASFHRKNYGLSIGNSLLPTLGEDLIVIGSRKDDSGNSLLPPDAKRYGFIKLTGEPAFEDRFELASAFSEGFARIHTGMDKTLAGGKSGFIDKTGKVAIQTQFTSARDFHEGLAAAAVGGTSSFMGLAKNAKWGFIDKNGAFVINPQFEMARDFSGGLAAVRIGGQWGYIDSSGKFQVNPQFPSEKDDVSPDPFYGPLACVVGCEISPIYANRRGEVVVFKTSLNDTQNQKPSSKRGSGFFVSSLGHIITNAHVVDECKTLKVVGPKEFTAELLALDKANDLALLKGAIAPEEYAAISSNPAKLGQEVVAFGFPLAGVLSSEGNVTSGTVSSLAGLGDNSNHIQISAPVQQGNSGGPVFDRKGSVIGIVLQKLDASKVAKVTGDIPQNVNFAIKADVVLRLLGVQGIKPKLPSVFSIFDQSGEELAQRAKSVSVAIECN